jgi:hypothetical protein
MDPTADELAGIVDLFGALTRAELRRALDELAFKQNLEVDDASRRIDAAIDSYHLVEVTADFLIGTSEPPESPVIVLGPAAFPALPANAADLPHIMAVPAREVDTAAVKAVVTERFEQAVEDAVANEDETAAASLLDVSYELAAWGMSDLDAVRSSLEEVTDH